MAGADKDFLRTLKEKVNIVDVAGGYLTLEKRGGSYWACCPFHHEKTPSFAINEGGQYYHCFGCGESGDVIKFVSELESLDFMDTVKLLAQRVNLPVPEMHDDSQQTVELKRKRDELLKILNETAHFYLDNLRSGKADAHVDYILKRQIPSNMVRTFGLGASLNFTDLPRFLLSKGHTKQDIVDSGVVNEANGRLTDAQGGRLVFPIINSYGEVIAFGGRALQKTDFAKYVNTRDTLIFNKRKNLYNINLLKNLKRSQSVKQVIMVEGYMDTISLYQAGFKNVVASMGTSLTQDQARLVKRYADTVLISYDGDGAGQKANLRGLDILKEAGLNVKVVPLTDGLDPDDIIKKYGAEGYQACLDRAMPLIDYKLTVLERGVDMSQADEKRKFIAEALAVIRTADSEAEREELLKRLRDSSGISFEALRRDLEAKPVSSPPTVEEKEKSVRKDNASAVKKASRFVLSGFLFGEEYAQGVDISAIPFTDDVHVIVATYIRSKKLMEEQVRISELFEFFDENTPEYDELTRILDYSEGAELIDGGMPEEVAERYFFDCIRTMKIAQTDAAIAEEKQKLKGVNDLEIQKQILNRISELTLQKKKLKSGAVN